jgi:hypothetical protein
MNYTKIEQKLYRVWDEDKKDWWAPDQKILNKKLNGFFLNKQDAEASIKFWKRQETNLYYVNVYYPRNYTIVGFDIVESSN